jgi:hypothetical protein
MPFLKDLAILSTLVDRNSVCGKRYNLDILR